MKNDDVVQHDGPPEGSLEPDPPFGSNAVRLRAGQWAAVALIAVVILAALPRVWTRIEPLAGEADFRLPYAQSDDYWEYSRYASRAATERKIAVIGDSVIWGEYVLPQQTLTHYLNEQQSHEKQADEKRPTSTRFVNLGLNGAHPLALQGLVSCYGTAVQDMPVFLHCNLLWMSSPERDLQTDKEMSFNHPRLVPQFVPSIPCYKAPLADRMGIVVDRNLTVRGWAQHLRIAFFQGQDVPGWTLEHPYANPLAQIRLTPLRPDEELRHAAVPWYEQGIQPQDLPWVKLESSLQWRAFRQTVECLQARGCRVLVVVGPLNEHMLTPASGQRHRALRAGVEDWLSRREVPYLSPPLLPSDEYADASHPLSAGYRRLALWLDDQPEFQRWRR